MGTQQTCRHATEGDMPRACDRPSFIIIAALQSLLQPAFVAAAPAPRAASEADRLRGRSTANNDSSPSSRTCCGMCLRSAHTCTAEQPCDMHATIMRHVPAPGAVAVAAAAASTSAFVPAQMMRIILYLSNNTGIRIISSILRMSHPSDS